MKRVVVTITILLLYTSVAHTQNDLLKEAKKYYDNKFYNSAVGIYSDFVLRNPNADQKRYALKQIADINFEMLKDYDASIFVYQIIADNYPYTRDAKEALFVIAFIYDDHLKDKETAIIKYKEFIDLYKDDPPDINDKMVESARVVLKVLETGKTIKEVMEENK